MTNLYFNPGCALSIYKPGLASKIHSWLNNNYSTSQLHDICCRHQPGLPSGSVIINICAGCDRRFRSLYEGVSTVSLWDIIDESSKFEFPDYGGAGMSLQDPCPVRTQPKIHRAVRNLLKKMNISLEESEHHGGNSVCCGDSLYGHADIESVLSKMKERAGSMPCDEVAVYCVSCIKAMYSGGKPPRYLPDLLFGEAADPQEYHTQLEEYISRH